VGFCMRNWIDSGVGILGDCLCVWIGLFISVGRRLISLVGRRYRWTVTARSARSPGARYTPPFDQSQRCILLLIALPQRHPSRLALFLFDGHLLGMLFDLSINRILFAQHCLWCAVADFPLPLVESHHLLLLELSQKLASSILACPAEALDLVALVRMCFQLAA
jgi:hypothetical protein